MKFTGVKNQLSPVVPAQKSPLIKQNIERHKPVIHPEIKDYVTISQEAKVRARQITPVLIKDQASSILSYEIRKPFTVPNLRLSQLQHSS